MKQCWSIDVKTYSKIKCLPIFGGGMKVVVVDPPKHISCLWIMRAYFVSERPDDDCGSKPIAIIL
jgi:hypothetical protein